MTQAKQTVLTGILQDRTHEAEEILLGLADSLYANTGLKPMSKTLFALSRILLAVYHANTKVTSATEVSEAYESARETLGDQAPADDYSLKSILAECGSLLPRITHDLGRVIDLTPDQDTLGLVFNTLVRGKWDSGEGLGTFLTPEEVVEAMVTMALGSQAAGRTDIGSDQWEDGLMGDICGGTGRFVYSLAQGMMRRGHAPESLGPRLALFDQSSLAIDLARMNLHFLGLSARCEVVRDSLIAPPVTDLAGRFSVLATNPPFGASKYEITSALARSLPRSVLANLESKNGGSSVDPAALFVFRNLDLLMAGGVLAIVLPDGVVQSPSFVEALKAYEKATNGAIDIRALVSLPPVTFSLGGTVAKTSFLIIQKDGAPVQESSMFIGEARHVGFLRKGNRRVPDRDGNDLPTLAEGFLRGPDPLSAQWASGWRQWERLGLILSATNRAGAETSPVGSFGEPVRDFTTVARDSAEDFHISILDVDETGLLDIAAVATNRPASRVLACTPGDVLVSCINPRIWRVAIVPDLPGRWTCSPEFLVLRAKNGVDPWRLYLRCHHPRFMGAVQRMAGGTSSSRQRVSKDDIPSLELPEVEVESEVVSEHKASREHWYKMRLSEWRAYRRLQADGVVLPLSSDQ